MFDQDPNNTRVQELMGKFAQALNQLGRLVLERYGGKYTALVESAGESAEELLRLFSAMTFFNDFEVWHGRRIPFYKRAQLTAADLALAFDHRGWGHFRDLDELTIFADNLVPHVLRLDGVYKPSYPPAPACALRPGRVCHGKKYRRYRPGPSFGPFVVKPVQMVFGWRS